MSHLSDELSNFFVVMYENRMEKSGRTMTGTLDSYVSASYVKVHEWY